MKSRHSSSVATVARRSSFSKSQLLTATLLAAMLASSAQADTLSSTAGASAVWGTASNWFDGSAPLAADDVLIDRSTNSATNVLGLNGAQSANSLTFGSSTGTPLGAFSLLANTSGTTTRTLTLTQGAITVDSSVTGPITLGGSNGGLNILLPNTNAGPSSSITVASGKTLIINAALTNTGANLILSGGGTVVLAGNNSAGGGSGRTVTTDGGGTLALNNAAALGHSGNTFVISAGSTLDNTSGAAITLNNTNAISVGGNFTFTGTNNLTANGTVTFNNSVRTITTTDSTLTLGGLVSNGGLIKAGAGTLVLGSGGAYASATTINAGTLKLGGSLTASSLVTVAGGTLSGNDTAGNIQLGVGNVSVTSGAVSAGGSAAGSFSLAANRNFNATGGVLNFDVGTGFDQIIGSGTGTFSIGSATTIALTLGAGFDYTSTYNLFTGFASGTVSSTANITGYDTANYTAILGNGTTGALGTLSFTATAVPEPGTYAAFAAGAALAFAAYRRRQKRS